MRRNRTLALVFACLAGSSAYAQTCVNQLFAANYGQTIAVVTSDPYITSSNIADAIGKWQSCPQFGSGFPALVAMGPADLSFEVMLIAGSNPTPGEGCAEIRAQVNGFFQIVGGTIVVWDATFGGMDCEPFRARSIAHEIGHALNLANSTCSGYLMAAPQTPGDIPQSDECAQVDNLWWTYNETQSGCYAECRGTCDEQGNCTDPNPSPIIIDIAGRGYHLTDAATGVRFDLDADGFMEDVAWTSAGDAGNAFLVLDINHNGAIDNGGELFGNYSVLPDGLRATNGFAALAAYDTQRFGGNGDGWIDSGDAIWPLLRLWFDTNHDGISQPTELMSLDAGGIVRISTRYDTERRRDQFGNVFRYRGTCLVRAGEGRAVYRNLYDVFLRAR